MNFEKKILEKIIFQINKNPTKKAFCINECNYTYRDFGKRISAIRGVIKKNHSSESLFAIEVNDDLNTYASIIAIWLEGKGFVSLHPNNPLDRSKEIVNQTNVKSIISSNKKIDLPDLKKVDLDFNFFDDLEIIEDFPESNIAYILFTSGSTGKPKGVVINRKNINQFFSSFWLSGININSNDKCLQCFDLTFDVSIQTFLAPLMVGASLYTVPYNKIKFSYVYHLLENEKLTFAVIVPSMLRYLKPFFDEINLPKLNTCILTAEASPLDLVKKWYGCIPNAQIFNFYGPTEATIYCTYYKVPRLKIKNKNGMLSIGKPMEKVKAKIFNSMNEEVKSFKKGELCISSDQLTTGYWKNEKLNNKVFIIKGGIKYYMTGDLCFRDNDNYIYLLGRKDDQIKIDGYRIELGEIEFNTKKIIDKEAVVIAKSEDDNIKLILFVESSIEIGDKVLDKLKNKLPNYMLPSKIFCLKTFPLNSNNKIDRVNLKNRI